MTLAEQQAYVGAPAVPGATYTALRADVLVTAWEDTLSGEGGWWYALTRGRIIIALGWTAGARRDRDIEIARKLAPLEPIADEVIELARTRAQC